ncbi:uncharacterized protein BX663DRAFT_71055 [Cokeromyces recurvatus]|uniref:uncharacterized protein n=1 Tax=Cokeromyces recurvatus TaxID=90255 RepID=UPI00221FF562|nr:uncharacterized protein BX663DRAFT_71055 [Cokeromyces recurvatus]KAI7902287.1 hypothetical protein BX663DRAFT_71055 [Cokeromyces recurvatus]
MPTITRERAICMLFGATYSDENCKKYVKIIDELEGLDICYNEDPMEPIVISTFKINAYPLKYSTYNSKTMSPTLEKEEDEVFKKSNLANQAQLVDFVNSVILPYDPLNDDIYECRRMETKEILALLMKHTDLLNKKTVSSFGKWLKSAKVDLLKSPDKRVLTSDNEKVQVRNLYVMKEKFLVDTANNIAKYLHNYQTNVNALKKMVTKLLDTRENH